MIRLAVFDIDGTLTRGPRSTEFLFFRYLLKCGLLGHRQFTAYTKYALCNWRRGRYLLKSNKNYLTGLSQSTVSSYAADWLSQQDRIFWNEATIECLVDHRDSGDHILLLSGTLQEIADSVGEKFEVHTSIGSLVSTRNGMYTAGPPLRHPYRDSKRKLLRKLLDKLNVSPRNTTAYGDSIDDLELLEFVAHPVAVNPDALLRHVALNRSWKVL